MLTSNFSIMGKNPLAISIALYDPYFYTGRRCPELAPTRTLLSEYKLGTVSEEEYIKIYTAEILDKLDPVKLYWELGPDTILLCHCSAKPGVFCHRHLVAEWFNAAPNLNVSEYRKE